MRTVLPLALVAGLACSTASAQWVSGAAGVIYYNSGKIGIGTTAPTGQLHVVASTGLGSVRAENLGGGAAVIGWSRAATGVNYGVLGQAHGSSGYGLFGWATNPSGVTVGVQGQADSPSGFAGLFKGGQYGVYGWPTAASGPTVGVYGRVTSLAGWGGIFKGGKYGVWAEVAPGATEPWAGWFLGRSYFRDGVSIGTTDTQNGLIVRGDDTAALDVANTGAGGAIGINVSSLAPLGAAINAESFQDVGTDGTAITVRQHSDQFGYGVYATSDTPNSTTIYAEHTATDGSGTALSVFQNQPNARAVKIWGGEATDVTGIPMCIDGAVYGAQARGMSMIAWAEGESDIARAISAETMALSGVAVYARGASGVSGETFNTSPAGGSGVLGHARQTSGLVYGVIGISDSPAGHAVYADGRMTATGTKSFEIDHPLDPEHKTLSHYCAEGPEPFLIYRGRAVLDEQGTAVVTLPEYFDAINRDVEYQLTPIGGAAPMLHIAEEVRDNRFVIAGGGAGMKVSWTVTGVRNDAYVRAHPPAIEEEKTGPLEGKYLDPISHGKPASLRATGEAQAQPLPERPSPPARAPQPAPAKRRPAKSPAVRAPEPAVPAALPSSM